MRSVLFKRLQQAARGVPGAQGMGAKLRDRVCAQCPYFERCYDRQALRDEQAEAVKVLDRERKRRW